VTQPNPQVADSPERGTTSSPPGSAPGSPRGRRRRPVRLTSPELSALTGPEHADAIAALSALLGAASLTTDPTDDTPRDNPGYTSTAASPPRARAVDLDSTRRLLDALGRTATTDHPIPTSRRRRPRRAA
jgi:hypothetical protein